MNRLLLAVCFLVALTLPAHAREKPNTVVIHPGEVVYARFEVKGTKLKLVATSKEKDDAAQLVFSFHPDPKLPLNMLKLENKFPRDLNYRMEMRAPSRKQRFPREASPVVGGKLAFEAFPRGVEEVALFDFRLAK